MKKTSLLVIAVCMFITNIVSADTFGTGANQFEVDFVTISGDASSANGTNISNYSPDAEQYKAFADPGHDYRIGTYEITNDQWNKFVNSVGGTVTGSASTAYDENPSWTGSNMPTNEVSWYEATQFVNWLNIINGHQTAYKFTGTQGTSDYTFSVWDATDAGFDASNPFRNSNAYYFLPTEDEWVKAAYWNGSYIQTYATIENTVPVAGVGANYDWAAGGAWPVANGIGELNSTFNMMGNVWEWMESPFWSGDYSSGSIRGMRGGSYYGPDSVFISSARFASNPSDEFNGYIGFRVASIPEPTTLSLLALGAFFAGRRRR